MSTRRLNEQVKRNFQRFPPDFVFRLTSAEKSEVIAKCDHLRKLRFAKSLPLAFTEHGAIMAAGVLNSSIAIEMSIFVVRTFVELRKMLGPHERLAAKLNELDRKVAGHDQTIAGLIDAIRQLIAPPERKSRSIGFTADLRKAKTPQT